MEWVRYQVIFVAVVTCYLTQSVREARATSEAGGERFARALGYITWNNDAVSDLFCDAFCAVEWVTRAYSWQ